jgi:hypothetical protein
MEGFSMFRIVNTAETNGYVHDASRPWLAIDGKHVLGRFETDQEAVAALRVRHDQKGEKGALVIWHEPDPNDPIYKEGYRSYSPHWARPFQPPHRFGLHTGHLTQCADRIARRHGAWHVNHTEPNGQRRGWFCAHNRGSPFDQSIAEAINAHIDRLGGIDRLRHRRDRED